MSFRVGFPRIGENVEAHRAAKEGICNAGRAYPLLYPFKRLLIRAHKRSPWIAPAQYRVVNVVLTPLSSFVNDVASPVARRSSYRQLWSHFQHSVPPKLKDEGSGKVDVRPSRWRVRYYRFSVEEIHLFRAKPTKSVCLAEISLCVCEYNITG